MCLYCDWRTEKDNDIIVFVENVLQHSSIDFFDFPWYLQSILVRDPRQYLVFVIEIAGINQWVFISEERESWKVFDAIFLRCDSVLGGDEYNTRLVEFIIDILQFVEDTVAFLSFIATSTCHNFWLLISNESRKKLLLLIILTCLASY